MSVINTKKTGVRAKSHLNWMGGPSYDVKDALLKLRIAASSCFFGEPQYYHKDRKNKRQQRTSYQPHRWTDRDVDYLRTVLDAIDPREWRGLNPTELMEKAIDDALDVDLEGTLKEAVRLRNEENIRTTPQVILVRAAHHPNAKGNGLVRKYAKQIIRRADEPAVGMAYHLWKYGRKISIPTRLKRSWKDALERFNEYQLSKYRMENREVKTVDVVNMVHPSSEAVNKLVKGELKTTGKTWESIISEKGSSPETWTEAIGVMGHMALLRNLRNLQQHKVNPIIYLEKLVEGAEKGKQLPFRYYSAYRALGKDATPAVRDAIEECLMASLGNLPKFSGRVMSLCDNSGSARGTTTSSMGTMQVATIANLSGVLTGMRADEGHLGVFGDTLKTFSIRKRSSVFDQLGQAESLGTRIGGATEHGIWLFWDRAIKQKEYWDHVFVYSDMQAGHGGLYGKSSAYDKFAWPGNPRYIDVPKLISQYRSKVNSKVMVYLVQVAGYQDTIVPEFYDRTYVLGGWGDGLLRFAAEMANISDMPTQ